MLFCRSLSVSQCLSLSHVYCFCALWNETQIQSFSVFSAIFKRLSCFSYFGCNLNFYYVYFVGSWNPIAVLHQEWILTFIPFDWSLLITNSEIVLYLLLKNQNVHYICICFSTDCLLKFYESHSQGWFFLLSLLSVLLLQNCHSLSVARNLMSV